MLIFALLLTFFQCPIFAGQLIYTSLPKSKKRMPIFIMMNQEVASLGKKSFDVVRPPSPPCIYTWFLAQKGVAAAVVIPGGRRGEPPKF